MPRPTIKQDLAVEVRRIHTQTHGEEAGSFQEALDTVVQLAQENRPQSQQQTEQREGWYPGKYAGKVLNQVVGGNADRSEPSRSFDSAAQVPTDESYPSPRPPSETAIFKARYDDDSTVELPAPEVDALELTDGDLLQIFAYHIGTSEESPEQ